MAMAMKKLNNRMSDEFVLESVQPTRNEAVRRQE